MANELDKTIEELEAEVLDELEEAAFARDARRKSRRAGDAVRMVEPARGLPARRAPGSTTRRRLRRARPRLIARMGDGMQSN